MRWEKKSDNYPLMLGLGVAAFVIFWFAFDNVFSGIAVALIIIVVFMAARTNRWAEIIGDSLRFGVGNSVNDIPFDQIESLTFDTRSGSMVVNERGGQTHIVRNGGDESGLASFVREAEKHVNWTETSQ